MPNVCKNDLFISGPVDDLQAFLAAANGMTGPGEDDVPLDFGKFIPEPQYENPDDRRSCYNWRVEHWGTHCNADRTFGDDIIGRYVMLSFVTAWAPPKPVVTAMAKAYPSLEFALTYYRKGWGVAGRVRYEHGVAVYDVERPYSGKKGG